MIKFHYISINYAGGGGGGQSMDLYLAANMIHTAQMFSG